MKPGNKTKDLRVLAKKDLTMRWKRVEPKVLNAHLPKRDLATR